MDRLETREILSKLHEASGISGRESMVGEQMKELLAGCYDEFFIDTLGNSLSSL